MATGKIQLCTIDSELLLATPSGLAAVKDMLVEVTELAARYWQVELSKGDDSACRTRRLLGSTSSLRGLQSLPQAVTVGYVISVPASVTLDEPAADALTGEALGRLQRSSTDELTLWLTKMLRKYDDLDLAVIAILEVGNPEMLTMVATFTQTATSTTTVTQEPPEELVEVDYMSFVVVVATMIVFFTCVSLSLGIWWKNRQRSRKVLQEPDSPKAVSGETSPDSDQDALASTRETHFSDMSMVTVGPTAPEAEGLPGTRLGEDLSRQDELGAESSISMATSAGANQLRASGDDNPLPPAGEPPNLEGLRPGSAGKSKSRSRKRSNSSSNLYEYELPVQVSVKRKARPTSSHSPGTPPSENVKVKLRSRPATASGLMSSPKYLPARDQNSSASSRASSRASSKATRPFSAAGVMSKQRPLSGTSKSARPPSAPASAGRSSEPDPSRRPPFLQ